MHAASETDDPWDVEIDIGSDPVVLDMDRRELNLHVSAAELERRQQQGKARSAPCEAYWPNTPG